MKPKNYDFGGYATRHDVRCGDGRTIRPGAFKDEGGKKVPLVYQHLHNDIENVLGHAMLECRKDGVYAYCTFNNSEKADLAKEAVLHGDITALSIYANKLKEQAGNVFHGVIREVSLVLSGANPEATIDNVAFAHGEGFSDSDAIIYSGLELDHRSLRHAEGRTVQEVYDELTDEQKAAVDILIGSSLEAAGVDPDEFEQDLEDEEYDDEEYEDEDEDEEFQHSSSGGNMRKDVTVQEVYDAMSEEQKAVVDILVGAAVEAAQNGELDEADEMAQSGMGGYMRHNVFDRNGMPNNTAVLSHSDIEEVFADIHTAGSLQEGLLMHGITNVEALFPEARSATPTPETISREMAWVSNVMSSTRKSPFARVKSTAIDITEDEARAKGYIKGRQKMDEMIVAMKRVTTPQTVYKKQKMDRDDIIDITDFDVVSYLNAEMRVMLNEEIARAVLIGDGRSVSAEDKINPLNIRPVWQDDDLYTMNYPLVVTESETLEEKAERFIDEVIRQRKNYKGSGNPVCFMGTDLLTACRLMKDNYGYRRYKTDKELADDIRVSAIVQAEVFDGITRDKDSTEYTLAALIVNLQDYTIGTDKGGEITSFEDFDIDFNQQKYLIETRLSGALTKPKSAQTFEFAYTAAAPTPGE